MIGDDFTGFDQDIIIHINTVLTNLVQMGVGPEEGFTIFDESAKWQDFIGDKKNLQQVKTYVYIKVRLVFDPPTNTALMDALKEQAHELEVRMYTEMGGY